MSDPATNPMASGPVVENDPAQRTQAMIAHFLGFFVVLGPGIFYLIKKNDATASAFLKDQIKEVFNWNILVLVAYVALVIVGMILIKIMTALALLVMLAYLALWLGNLVLVILNGMKASKGIAARYPFKIAVLK